MRACIRTICGGLGSDEEDWIFLELSSLWHVSHADETRKGRWQYDCAPWSDWESQDSQTQSRPIRKKSEKKTLWVGRKRGSIKDAARCCIHGTFLSVSVCPSVLKDLGIEAPILSHCPLGRLTLIPTPDHSSFHPSFSPFPLSLVIPYSTPLPISSEWAFSHSYKFSLSS